MGKLEQWKKLELLGWYWNYNPAAPNYHKNNMGAKIRILLFKVTIYNASSIFSLILFLLDMQRYDNDTKFGPAIKTRMHFSANIASNLGKNILCGEHKIYNISVTILMFFFSILAKILHKLLEWYIQDVFWWKSVSVLPKYFQKTGVGYVREANVKNIYLWRRQWWQWKT